MNHIHRAGYEDKRQNGHKKAQTAQNKTEEKRSKIRRQKTNQNARACGSFLISILYHLHSVFFCAFLWPFCFLSLFRFALVLLAATPAFAASASDTVATAERAFAEGVESRNDAAKARPAFARAAAGYDVLWNQGVRTPELALNRARAHRLAGSLPKCVAALHDGLAVARFARPLQVELEDARAAVPFPLDGELAAQCRPEPVRGVSARMSPAEAWFLTGSLWLFACAGVARFAMVRNALWLTFAGLCVVGLLVLGGLWLRDAAQRSRADALPLLVVSDDVLLRKGNADAFPPRLEPALPKGTECRELARRGGWVQVQLAGGAVGWVPDRAVIACDGS
jgi:hypothetical protein